MGALPKITVVTPSYNQARFLEQTILSVLNQDYPCLEYLIMDGGSTDGSADIIRKYEDRLAYWVSEPDNGQADAICRGLERSTGEILAWLNSDDYYLPGALAAVGRFFSANPRAELLIGNSIVVNEQGRLLYKRRAFPVSFERLLYWTMGFAQPASFWKRQPFFETGGFDRSMQFCFDLDMYLRLTQRRPAYLLRRYLAAFRHHPASKTSTMPEVRRCEDEQLYIRYGRCRRPSWHLRLTQRKFRIEDDWRMRWHHLLSLLALDDDRVPTWQEGACE